MIWLQQLCLRMRYYCSASLLSLPPCNETTEVDVVFLCGLVGQILVTGPAGPVPTVLHTHCLLCRTIDLIIWKKLTSAVLMVLKVVATSEWEWSMSAHWRSYRTWTYQEGKKKSTIYALCSDIAAKTEATAHSINSFKSLVAPSFCNHNWVHTRISLWDICASLHLMQGCTHNKKNANQVSSYWTCSNYQVTETIMGSKNLRSLQPLIIIQDPGEEADLCLKL